MCPVPFVVTAKIGELMTIARSPDVSSLCVAMTSANHVC